MKLYSVQYKDGESYKSGFVLAGSLFEAMNFTADFGEVTGVTEIQLLKSPAKAA